MNPTHHVMFQHAPERIVVFSALEWTLYMQDRPEGLSGFMNEVVPVEFAIDRDQAVRIAKEYRATIHELEA